MMKIPFNKIPGFNHLPPLLRNNPKLFLLVLTGLGIALALLASSGSKDTEKIKKSLKLSEAQNYKGSGDDKDVGILTGSVDTKSYVARIEKQYYDISSKFDRLEERIASLEKSALELRKNQSDVSKIVLELDKKTAETKPGNVFAGETKEKQGQGTGLAKQAFNESSPAALSLKKGANLEMAKVGEIKLEDKLFKKRYAYLPLGSFVKCTLLTGVYAPANENNPLPVLLSIDEAFYGPNNSRIPLKGAFAIGKVVGDVVSKRAVVQIVGFSIVFPDGKVFEREENLGYLADNDGRLGIPGELIYNTGKQLGLNFLSGFLAGSAEALSQAETSTVTGAFGQTSRNVTGNSGRYSMFSGLANSAEGMSSYYQKQLEALIPAVRIEAGSKAIFVVQKGVELEGLEISGNTFGFIDN